MRFSPCLRGCFCRAHLSTQTIHVFPVLTGVFLDELSEAYLYVGFPRAYGGVSLRNSGKSLINPFSPCLRGCFLFRPFLWYRWIVFPVLTGVFLDRAKRQRWVWCFPRAYGGVSIYYICSTSWCWFSPCLRGCFWHLQQDVIPLLVFPVLTGVFPVIIKPNMRIICFPRAYGGVSAFIDSWPTLKEFSPCLRGCFQTIGFANTWEWVFPVLTGVFLYVLCCPSSHLRFPRAYGGVSWAQQGWTRSDWFSPCLRGCFCTHHSVARGGKVFPVLTGVFLPS